MSALVTTLPMFVRPLLGIGLLATFVMLFKPLLIGLLRAALLMLQPRQSLEQRNTARRLRDMLMLTSMTRELDATDPALATELRALAARG